MKGKTGFILLLLLFTQICFTQEEISIELSLNEATKDLPISNRRVTFYSATDSLTLITDSVGTISLRSSQYPDFLKQDHDYKIRVHKDAEISVDHFAETNTRFNHGTIPTRKILISLLLDYTGMIVIPFKQGQPSIVHSIWNSIYNTQNVFENVPDAQLTLIGLMSDHVDWELAEKRASYIAETLVKQGINANQITIAILDINHYTGEFPEYNENYDHGVVCDFDWGSEPCSETHRTVINFDKVTNEIVETKCDSLQHIYDTILSQEEDFAVIGIYSNPEGKSKAKKRARLIRKKLIKMGIDHNRLIVYTAYFKPNEHRDWPFYPEHYDYEIGVYFEIEYP